MPKFQVGSNAFWNLKLHESVWLEQLTQTKETSVNPMKLNAHNGGYAAPTYVPNPSSDCEQRHAIPIQINAAET